MGRQPQGRSGLRLDLPRQARRAWARPRRSAGCGGPSTPRRPATPARSTRWPRGVLPIALGEATKTVPFLMDADKTYRFTIAWGATTASFDREGAVTATLRRAPDAARRSPRRCRPSSARSSRSRRPFPPSRSTASAPTTWPARASRWSWSRAPVMIHARRGRRRAGRRPRRDRDRLRQGHLCPRPGPRPGRGARRLRPCQRRCAAPASGPFTEARAITLEKLEDLCHRGAGSEALLPVETALDDIPALAVTTEDAFRLTQGDRSFCFPDRSKR